MRAFAHILLPLLVSLASSYILNASGLFPSEDWIASLLCHCLLAAVIIFIGHIKTDSKSYTELLLGTIAGKLLLLMAFYFLFSFQTKRANVDFVVHFMIHYVLFTVSEVRYLLHIIRAKIGKSDR